MADIKWSAFPSIGALATGDTLVGLRAGANVKFNALTIPWTVANGGTGLSTTTAYSLIAAGTTATGNFQAVGTGTAGQLLQSGGASALPTWTTSTFPSGSGTLNHMLRSDGTNWVQTTATTLTSADVLSGLTQLNVDNLTLDGNTFSSTNANGNINIVPNGTGDTIFGGAVALDPNSIVQGYAVSKAAAINFATYATTDLGSSLYLGASGGTTPGTFTAVSSSRILGQIVFQGADGTGLLPCAQIVATASGTIGVSQIPTKLDFKTATSAGTLTTGMTLSSAQILTVQKGISTGVSGTSSGLNTFLTNNAAAASPAQVYQIAKSVASSGSITFLQITVPAGVYFIAIECFISVSRAAVAGNVGTSLVEKKYFAIARNGSGSDVVLDGLAGSDFVATTTTAGGAINTGSGATTIVRNGAEANTDPQVVNLTLTTGGGSAVVGLIFNTINVHGSTTGLVIA